MAQTLPCVRLEVDKLYVIQFHLNLQQAGESVAQATIEIFMLIDVFNCKWPLLRSLAFRGTFARSPSFALTLQREFGGTQNMPPADIKWSDGK